MKYLFCGLGSVGQRHLKNLLSLGEKDIIAFRTRNIPLKGIKQKIPVFTDLESALKQNPDVGFITNPSACHVPTALKLAKSQCNLFIEKPLSSSLKGVSRLSKIVKDKKLIVQMGFMMRYHPAVKQIKTWLQKEIIGFPIFARATWGEYLPSWHPWEDYTQSYVARKNLGGGPINTLCHDIDLMSWFFGQPKSVFASKARVSSLKISTEHSADLLFQYKNNMTVNIHLDLIQLPPERKWQIVGNRGKINFDYYKNLLTLYTTDKDLKYNKKVLNYSDSFKRNDMFLEEVSSFINSVKLHKKPNMGLSEGIKNLQLTKAAYQSIKSKKIIEIKKTVL